jgi:broad specificity phosphatase PhoE
LLERRIPIVYTLIATILLGIVSLYAFWLQRPATTIIVVRHAEKAAEVAPGLPACAAGPPPSDQDVSLMPAGTARAQNLLDTLEDSGVSAIYVTQYRRTCETARRVFENQGIVPTVFPVGENRERFGAELAAEILANRRGSVVLVVSHSDTVPMIIEALGGGTIPPIAESAYDNLFIVTVPGLFGIPRLIEATYGAPT